MKFGVTSSYSWINSMTSFIRTINLIPLYADIRFMYWVISPMICEPGNPLQTSDSFRGYEYIARVLIIGTSV
jgi:hypothetical protein